MGTKLKTQIGTILKNPNCDKNKKNLIATKLKKSDNNKTQLKLQQNS